MSTPVLERLKALLADVDANKRVPTRQFMLDLLNDTIEHIKTAAERIKALESESEKFVETLVALEFEYNKKTNEMIRRHADQIERLKISSGEQG